LKAAVEQKPNFFTPITSPAPRAACNRVDCMTAMGEQSSVDEASACVADSKCPIDRRCRQRPWQAQLKRGAGGVYQSAHIAEAASELVIRSGHSEQSDPRTAREERRILLLHLRRACPSSALSAA
jgi:hypothetical protein